MYRGTITGILILAAALALACGGDSLEATVEQMREAACRGDVEGFMSHVDMKTVMQNERKQEIRAAKKSEGYKSDTDLPDGILGEIVLFIFEKMYVYDYYPLINEETRKIFKDASRTLGGYFWRDIESEIKKGKDSSYCSFTIIKAGRWSGDVTIRFRDTGKEAVWGFENDFGKWKLARLPYSYEGIETDSVAASPTAGPGDDISSESSVDALASSRHGETAGGDDANSFAYDFRKTRWGMSLSEVKSSENADYIGAGIIEIGDDEKYDTSLVYEDKIGGLDVTILYIFTNEKLSQAIYQFKSRYSDPDTYLVNFNKMVEAYKKKYGAPWEVKEEWKNEKYKNDPDKVGQALTEGHINYATTWQTLETEITVGLNKGNDISLYVYYLSKHYDEKYERLKREREAEKKEEKTEKKIDAREIEEKL